MDHDRFREGKAQSIWQILGMSNLRTVEAEMKPI